jgi:transcriptional regulator with XRE-family HTH domain
VLGAQSVPSEEARTNAARRCPPPSEVGRRLRERRVSRQLSLRELARRVAISPSALSEIETGKSRASLRILYRVVTELEVSLDELLGLPNVERRPVNGHEPRGAPRAATDRRQQPVAPSPMAVLDPGARTTRLTSPPDSEVEFRTVSYEPGGRSSADGSFVRGSGRLYGLILAGTLEITIGFETYVLDPGDSIAFYSSTPHRIRNCGDEAASVVWVRLRLAEEVPRAG